MIFRFIVYTIFVLNQDKMVIFMKRIVENEKANIIGAKIRQARVRMGMSQIQLSEQLELLAVYVCRGSISRIENGERAVTDIEIDAIAKVLKISPNELFEWENK